MPAVIWKCLFFDELTPHHLYASMQLRNEVFVVEQNCVFQDADNKDYKCYHLMGFVMDELVAYARLVPPGVSYLHPSIGRVVTSPKYRQSGFGKLLMQKAIDECYRIFGVDTIHIGAQLYLKHFYELFGFEQASETYLEDGIPHIEMRKLAMAL